MPNLGSWHQTKEAKRRRRAKRCPCGIGPATHAHNQPAGSGRMTDKSRAATIALVKTLAADLSMDTGHYAQTVASLGQHVQTLAADREAMQGFGVTDRAGRKS